MIKKQLDLSAIYDRHERLVEEIEHRGYSHNSPVDKAEIDYLLLGSKYKKWLNVKPDLDDNLIDLTDRCEECRENVLRLRDEYDERFAKSVLYALINGDVLITVQRPTMVRFVVGLIKRLLRKDMVDFKLNSNGIELRGNKLYINYDKRLIGEFLSGRHNIKTFDYNGRAYIY